MARLICAMLATLAGPTVASSSVPRPAPALVATHRISPELDPVSSDTFFKKDYPDDLAPKVAHHFDHPFPTVQDDDRYDKDYVRDENDDGGEWKAQTEYDNLRNQLRKEQLEYEKALAKEREEWRELQDAKAGEAAAEKAAVKLEDDAGKAKHDAKEAEEEVEKVTGAAGGNATANVEDELTDLEKCKKELEKAKEKLKKLMEEREKLQGIGAEDAAKKAAAEAAAADAENAEEKLEKSVQEEWQEYQDALKQNEKEQKDVEKVKAELEAAAKRLRVFRKRVDADGGVYRSGVAPVAGVRGAIGALLFSLAALVA